MLGFRFTLNLCLSCWLGLNFEFLDLILNFIMGKLLDGFVVVERLEVLDALVVVGVALDYFPDCMHADRVVEYEDNLAKHF